MLKKILTLLTIVLSTTLFGDSADSNNNSPDKIYSPTDCYTIEYVLGEGAFGRVWAVTNSQGQRYALKSYKSQSNPYMAASLFADAEREFQRGQLLDHPNIVKTIELFKDSTDMQAQTTYLVLEYIQGETVYRTPKKTLAPDEAIRSCIQLVDAFNYALSHELIFLDLHANNVMLSDSHEAMIIDLASFFSFDEIMNFTRVQSTDDESSPTPKNVRHKKLEAFFQKNPELLNEMQTAIKKIKKSKLNSTETGSNNYLIPIFAFYVDNMSDMCIYILNKSSLPREEKVQLYTKIKQIAWHCDEDVDEDTSAPVEFYLQQLTNAFSS